MDRPAAELPPLLPAVAFPSRHRAGPAVSSTSCRLNKKYSPTRTHSPTRVHSHPKHTNPEGGTHTDRVPLDYIHTHEHPTAIVLPAGRRETEVVDVSQTEVCAASINHPTTYPYDLPTMPSLALFPAYPPWSRSPLEYPWSSDKRRSPRAGLPARPPVPALQ
eukprot:GHVU01059616.1.p1 GENE.GHVU01059616.1~~GHVU01059616.1.p1  ORF type:complete len:162 (-),score=1.72 GHVU01059616.1:924-1409(-)